jgi:hypothetical protein
VILTGFLLWVSRPSDRQTGVTSASEPVRTPPVTAEPTAVTAPVSAPQPVSKPEPVAAPVVSKPLVSKPVVPKPQVDKPAAKAMPADIEASPEKAAETAATRIELDASEPAWVSIRGGDGSTQLARLIEPGNVQSVDIHEPAVLRTGNAAGLTIRANGKSVGPLGPRGAIREVIFRDGGFKLVPLK